MNKNYLIIAAVIIGIVVIAGGGLFLMNQNSTSNSEDKMMAADEAMMTEDNDMEDDTMMEKDDDQMMKASSSKYITHTDGIIEETNGNERVLYFYANWCPTCRPVDKELSENQNQIPDGISVIRVNYNDPETNDEEDDLAKKYAVNYQHTFVYIDENGNEIATWSGGGLDELLEQVK